MKRKLRTISRGLWAVILIGALIALSACASAPAALKTDSSSITPPPAAKTPNLPDQSQGTPLLREIAGPPPSSLDQYFPPQAPAPLYMIEMFNLAGPFEGIGVDLQEGDMSNVEANFQAFQSEYIKVSKMVPEWTDKFPSDPVAALGKAIDGGDPAKIGQAMGAVGQVCSDCHLVNQVKVEQKYHWPDFASVTIDNPVTGQAAVEFGDYMVALGGAFSGMSTDLKEGQLDNARNNFQAFDALFGKLATDGCKQCHSNPVTHEEIPRKYFTDSDSLALVNQLGTALNASTPDPTAITNLTQAIGNGICVNCHLVHLPAQTTKDIWDKYGKLFK